MPQAYIKQDGQMQPLGAGGAGLFVINDPLTQTGTVSGTVAQNNVASFPVTFPTPFTSTPNLDVYLVYQEVPNWNDGCFAVQNLTNTGFTLKVVGSAAISVPVIYRWTATGAAAVTIPKPREIIYSTNVLEIKSAADNTGTTVGHCNYTAQTAVGSGLLHVCGFIKKIASFPTFVSNNFSYWPLYKFQRDYVGDTPQGVIPDGAIKIKSIVGGNSYQQMGTWKATAYDYAADAQANTIQDQLYGYETGFAVDNVNNPQFLVLTRRMGDNNNTLLSSWPTTKFLSNLYMTTSGTIDFDIWFDIEPVKEWL